MRTIRIFHPSPITAHSSVQLCDSAAGHVARVLRLQAGDPIELFDGRGGAYRAELSSVDKRVVSAAILEHIDTECESPLPIHLGQAVSRGDKMDFTIQKSVELGVTEITPLLSERCGVKLDAKRWAKKLEHWQQVAISACEQCGRNRIPLLHPPLSLSEWLAQPHTQLALTLHPRQATPLASLTDIPADGVRLLVGPEGGLTDEEISAALASGFRTTLLGPRILRTETAALAAIAALQVRFGDFA